MDTTPPRRDAGFTLIEVLVVVIIIGILSAIAIPSFASQRKKAVDASTKSDARVVATHLESFWTEHGAYPAAGATPAEIGWSPATFTLTIGDEPVVMSPGNTPRVYSTPDGVCVQVTNPRGTSASGHVWRTDGGGLQDLGADCTGYFTVLV